MSVQVVTRLPKAPAPDPLGAFARDLFAELPRSDQRRSAHLYLRGVLNAPGKKSIREIAAAAGAPGAAPVLQQFVNSSPWEWQPVRRALLEWAQSRTSARAWTIGWAVAPKRGVHTAGVHRRFQPELGKIVNCQAGIGLFLAGEHARLPVDWRMLLPGRWSRDAELMARARIPAQHREQSVSAHILNLVDSLAEESVSLGAPLVADLGHDRQASALARALADRRHDFVVGVPQATAMLPLEQDAAPEPVTALGGEPLDARRLLARHGRTVTALGQTAAGAGRMVRVSTCVVRLPGPARGRSLCRVFAPWPASGAGPGRVWVTNLVHERIERLLALAATADATVTTLGTLADGFGLADFEGRSYPGWHHHMTLTSAAYAYELMGRAPMRALAGVA
ncbi:hypothetical protein DWB77_04713 [Streptomyces hundungensis]|uniref:Transposase IS701-like DDE domain-containing protein n=1 Tax=Streptomyces hundungensis TaxID=1077946 RepID=A0A387HGH7_9ACTN|nr:transposase [Streptomyces hundungensis]AYG82534.1 hypothetical protein DWB77_04713 [Streptomyces hundungensis]